jgi:hypothetical protein
LTVDDLFPSTPTADVGLFVSRFEPERALVFKGKTRRFYAVTWAFVPEPFDESNRRVVTLKGANIGVTSPSGCQNSVQSAG